MTTKTTQTTLVTLRDYAGAFLSAKTAKAKAEVANLVAARASTSKRARWANFAKAVAAGDLARVTAYAAEGDAKRDAWAAVRAATPAKPKASKPVTKRAPAPTKQTAVDPLTALAEALASDEAAMVAFFQRVASLKAK